MIDPETKAVLQSIAQILKTQVVYLRNLHDAYSALDETVLNVDPSLRDAYAAEIRKIRPNPAQQLQLDAVDALLRQLEML